MYCDNSLNKYYINYLYDFKQFNEIWHDPEVPESYLQKQQRNE